MLNNCIIMGRMTRDPELRRTGKGTAVASFTLAVDRDTKGESGERETDFVDCVAWKGTAEHISKYFSKGSMAIVTGRLQMRNWTDKDGNKRRTAEIIASSVYFGEAKKQQEGSYPTMEQNSYSGGSGGFGDTLKYAESLQNKNYGVPAGPNDFAMLDDDDAQLPF